MDQTLNPVPEADLRPSLPGALKLFSWAVSFYKQHFRVLAGISAVPFIFGIVEILLSESSNIALVIALIVIGIAVGLLSQIALTLSVVGKGDTVSTAYKNSQAMILPYIWILVLTLVATLGGTILFVIPGILVAVWLSFPLYILFVEERRGTAALVRSWQYVQGYWGGVFWRFLFLGLVFVLLSIIVILLTDGYSLITTFRTGIAMEEVSFFSQVLGLAFENFFILPIAFIYSYAVYTSLKDIKTSTTLPDEQKIRRNLKIFSVIGIIALVGMLALSLFAMFGSLPGSI